MFRFYSFVRKISLIFINADSPFDWNNHNIFMKRVWKLGFLTCFLISFDKNNYTFSILCRRFCENSWVGMVRAGIVGETGVILLDVTIQPSWLLSLAEELFAKESWSGNLPHDGWTDTTVAVLKWGGVIKRHQHLKWHLSMNVYLLLKM